MYRVAATGTLEMISQISVSLLLLLLYFSIIGHYEVNSTQLHFDFPDLNQAKFANDLRTFEVIIPAMVDKQGDLVSHRLHHKTTRRWKRDVETDPNEKIHYHLQVEGQNLHVELEHNDKLLAPGLVFETRSGKFGNVSDAKIRQAGKESCHFRGTVRGHGNSLVALSTCNGLTGMLRTNNGDYLIEPVKGHERSDEGHQPHLIYKRSALPDDLHLSDGHGHDHEGSTCGVQEAYKIAEKQRAQWEKHRRRKRSAEKTEEHRRSKRSVSIERNVETLVVVDHWMMEFYKNEDIENYVLTIMNMVTTIFHDSTIGNLVNIALVRIMYLQEEEKDLEITHHADNTLNSFCKWQKSLNTGDENNPNHHDVAVLLTRKNICSRLNEPCSTLGLSQVSGMCQPHRSCNINEDTGLALAYTVAHELGHNFGMEHDTAMNGCEAPKGTLQHVMSPQLNADSTPLIWSNCSRASITRFLDRDWGHCLNDEPSGPKFEFPELPPGVMYDVHHQCRLQYGPEAQFCYGIDNICTTLWCQVENKCLTRLEAAAEGTLCGENEWCFAGECVTIGEKPAAIPGEWGQWAEWTRCTRSCDAGISYSERHCNNPPPSNGGKFCIGERKRFRICNTEECPPKTPTFRQKQCSDFDFVPYKNAVYEWEPVPIQKTPCQLHCKPKNRYFSVMLKDMVTDGTPCRPGRRDMCISGKCVKVGCDWQIKSKAEEDRCGVCHGDGSSCKTVKDKFVKKKGRGYVEAVIIPEGARNIRVEEVAEASNYLAVKAESGEYYLNGGWFIQWDGDYEAGGTTIHYTRKGENGGQDKFEAPGPLKEPLHIMLLYQGKNPGLEFEYTIPSKNGTTTREREFSWKYLDWTHCTSSCGGGTQRRQIRCFEKEFGEVEDRYCNSSARPEDIQRACNDHLCPARWWVGPWQHCSTTCGSGVHHRTVICVRSLSPNEQIALEDHECEDQPRPTSSEPCHHTEQCPEQQAWWVTSDWYPFCNGDPCMQQSRDITCSDSNAICDHTDRPIDTRLCGNITCGTWSTGNWSTCTRDCGGGIQFRSVSCQSGQSCLLSIEPAAQQICNTHQCTTTPSPSETTTAPTTTTTRPPPPKQHSSTTVLPTTETRQDLDNLKIKSPTENSSIRKPQATVQSATPTHNSSEDTEYYYYYYYDEDENKQNQESESQGNRQFKWIPLTWGECSKECGGGVKWRRIICMRTAGADLTETNPLFCEGLHKPELRQPCNTQKCTPWATSKWSECSASCGQGSQRRTVNCPDFCDKHDRPSDTRLCNAAACVSWVTGPWSECSATCGGGEKYRHVQCVDDSKEHPADGCDPDGKPLENRRCNAQLCPQAHRRQEIGAVTERRECPGNIMSYKVCHSHKRNGRCSSPYIQRKCCKACKPKTYTLLGSPTT